MKEDRSHIDEFFKTGLSGEAMDPSPEEWDSLEEELGAKEFFRFGWKHFNVYFLSMILASFVGMVWITLYLLFYQQSTPIYLPIPYDLAYGTDSVRKAENASGYSKDPWSSGSYIPDRQSGKPANASASMDNGSKAGQNVIDSLRSDVGSPGFGHSTIPQNQDNTNASFLKPVVGAPDTTQRLKNITRKTVKIVKRDTIRITDTLKSKRKITIK